MSLDSLPDLFITNDELYAYNWFGIQFDHLKSVLTT